MHLHETVRLNYAFALNCTKDMVRLSFFRYDLNHFLFIYQIIQECYIESSG